mmetsp:Transcript_15249/g.38012  ORF Transcript_15249/g.38012 Transcript_15249/m.38012 type:complete len:213 (+) Transcript_15249:471-1109(+)
MEWGCWWQALTPPAPTCSTPAPAATSTSTRQWPLARARRPPRLTWRSTTKRLRARRWTSSSGTASSRWRAPSVTVSSRLPTQPLPSWARAHPSRSWRTRASRPTSPRSGRRRGPWLWRRPHRRCRTRQRQLTRRHPHPPRRAGQHLWRPSEQARRNGELPLGCLYGGCDMVTCIIKMRKLGVLQSKLLLTAAFSCPCRVASSQSSGSRLSTW